MLPGMSLWSVVLCGALVSACSGSIETPTDEFPARQGGSRAAADDDDAAPAPRPQAPAANNDRPAPVASNDDDDALPPAGNDDEEDPLPPAGDDDEEDPAPAGGGVSFANDVQPIFNTTCGPCHAEQGLAGVFIGDSDIDAAFENAVDREDRVFARIEAGTMPPGCSGPPGSGAPCMTEEDFAVVEAWYEAGTPP